MSEPEFRRDLYRGTARDYDRFRVPYPPGLITDLAGRSGAQGRGRLLDLACGTGQLSLALHSYFEQVWAVDQEPGMVSVAREKAEAAGAGNIRFLTCTVAELAAPEESFDLITVGNAFHRLRREAAAASILRWLRPGGFLALVWGGSPWDGQVPWQQALSATMQRWRTRMADKSRIPPGYDQLRRERPDLAILRGSGFQFAGSYQFPTAHEWTPETLVGFLFSTSVLSRAALGDLAPGFEVDLRHELSAHAAAGRFQQTLRFAYELARRPV